MGTVSTTDECVDDVDLDNWETSADSFQMDMDVQLINNAGSNSIRIEQSVAGGHPSILLEQAQRTHLA